MLPLLAESSTVTIDGSWLAGSLTAAATPIAGAVVLATRMILAYLGKRDEQEKITAAANTATVTTLLTIQKDTTAALSLSTAAVNAIKEALEESTDVARRHRHAVGDLAHAAGLKKAYADARAKAGLPRDEAPIDGGS